MRTTKGLCLIACGVLAAACAYSPRTRAEQEHAETMERFVEGYNARAEGWFFDYHTRDVTWEGYGVWAPEGRSLSGSEMAELVEEELRRFPDRTMEVQQMIVDGDEVVLDYEWRGTAAVAMGPLQPGDVQSFRNIVFMSLRDGKVARIREYGLMSPPGSAPGR